MEKKYVALAFYHLTNLENPEAEVKKHKKFFENRDIKCRIYLSYEGINGQLSGEMSAVGEYKIFLTSNPAFTGVVFKEDPLSENIFPRATVKVRKRLVAFDREVDFSLRGAHLSPDQWRSELEKEEPYLLLDVRNDYESKIGHFDKAICPTAETFREFGDYADQLKESVDTTQTKVLMYCTGGIRCEYYSAYMKKIGFDKVFQLEGGVINYGHEEGSKHWKGKLFVFDDRLAVPIDGTPSDPISECSYCKVPSDTLYNCANMDCNKFFVACPSCIEGHKGCCSAECVTAPRVRAFDSSRGNKPFSRKHLVDLAK